MSHIHLHAPETSLRRIVTTCCPDCGRRTRLIGTFQDWYGWSDTCLRCGRSWADGEWLALPFMRGAREYSLAQARAAWRRSTAPVLRITHCDE